MDPEQKITQKFMRQKVQIRGSFDQPPWNPLTVVSYL